MMNLKKEFLTLRYAIGQYLQDRKSTDYQSFIEWYYINHQKDSEAIQKLFNHYHQYQNFLKWYAQDGYRIEQFRDRHKGETCFILGNGPSLNKMDLSLLKNYHTFGLNKIFLMFDKVDLNLSYHVAVNPYVIEQSKKEIESLYCPSFLALAPTKKYITPKQHIYTIRTGETTLEFSKDVIQGISEGYTVTYVAMQIAYFMGFEKVFLIGVDHSFNQKGNPNETQVMQGDDNNHFDPRYFAGKEWQLADLEGSELAYSLARFYFHRDNRAIYDATVEGKLQIFPKISFEQALQMAHPKNK